MQVLCYYIFAIAGNILFGKNDPWHFGNAHLAMMSLFRVSTGEDWTEMMYIESEGCTYDGYPYNDFPELCVTPQPMGSLALFFFSFFMMLCGYILLTLFIGIICAEMEASASAQTEFARTTRMVRDFRKRVKCSDTEIRAYRKLFMLIQELKGGMSHEVDLTEMMGVMKLMDVGGFSTKNQHQTEEEEELADAKISHIFYKFDYDKSGELDYYEFVRLMHSLVKIDSMQHTAANQDRRFSLRQKGDAPAPGDASNSSGSGEGGIPGFGSSDGLSMAQQLGNIDAAGGANLMTAGGVGMVGEQINNKVETKVAQLRSLAAEKYEELMMVQGMVATGDFSRAAELPKLEGEVAEHEKAASTAEEKAKAASSRQADKDAKKGAKQREKEEKADAKRKAKEERIGLVTDNVGASGTNAVCDEEEGEPEGDVEDDGAIVGEEERTPHENPFVQIGDALHSLTVSEGWSNCSLSVVVMAGIVVGMQVGYKMDDNTVLAGLDWFILGFFTFEVFIKIW
jgi:Ca2+-binding EF-hand superfamily protein